MVWLFQNYGDKGLERDVGGKTVINTYGFDFFAGREIFENGREMFAHLDFPGLGGGGFSYIDEFYRMMIKELEQGNKVLLSKSPGYKAMQERYDSEILAAICSVADKVGADPVPPKDAPRGEKSFLAGRKYLPLKEDQMDYIKHLFYNDESLTHLDDPFKYQPE